MKDEKMKEVNSISETKEGPGGKTFYKSVAVGSMTLEGGDVEAIESSWGWAVAAGVVMAIIGIFAMVYPVLTSVGTVFAIGAVIVVASISQLVHAFTVGRVGGFFWHLFVAFVYAAVGLMLLAYPLGGVITLTFLLSVYFMVSGVSKAAIALMSMDTHSWGWMLASGILSVILGILVITSWPVGSLWFLGFIVGIDLFFGGISLAATASSVHSMLKEKQA